MPPVLQLVCDCPSPEEPTPPGNGAEKCWRQELWELQLWEVGGGEITPILKYQLDTDMQSWHFIRMHLLSEGMAWGSSEPRNLVIPNRWYQRTILCWTFCRRRVYHVSCVALASWKVQFSSLQSHRHSSGGGVQKYLATEPLCQVCIVIEMVLQETGGW